VTRLVRLSITFNDQLNELLAQGEDRFGVEVARQKKAAVYATIKTFLARHPRAKPPHVTLRLRTYPISTTPFIVLYDFDDYELRIHFIVHRHSDLSEIDPSKVEW